MKAETLEISSPEPQILANSPDIDGDGLVNAQDPDMDGDGYENPIDADFNSDGIDDPIDFTNDHGSGTFIDEEQAGNITDFVFGMLCERLRLGEFCELKVAVLSVSEPMGTWNLKTIDGISINGIWSYPANRHENFNPFVGEIKSENRIVAQYPNGSVTQYLWKPGEPVGFYFLTRSVEETGKMAPVDELHQYVSQFPHPYPPHTPQIIDDSGIVGFSGDLPACDNLSLIGPIVDQQRAIFKIVTDWEKENYPAAE